MYGLKVKILYIKIKLMMFSKYKEDSKSRRRNGELKPRDQYARIKYYELFTPDMYFLKKT